MCEDSRHINWTVSGIKWKWANSDQTFDIGIWPVPSSVFSVSHYLLRWKIDNYILTHVWGFVPPGGWAFPHRQTSRFQGHRRRTDRSGELYFEGVFFVLWKWLPRCLAVRCCSETQKKDELTKASQDFECFSRVLDCWKHG